MEETVIKKLLPYQVPHTLQLVECLKLRKRVIDASDTGTGKTYAAIAVAKILNLQPFIICPKSTLKNWTDVCKYFEVKPLGVSNYEMLKEFGELNKRYGLGESMSMVYCKFNNDVIASSNITEITDYCNANSIQYITTMDFILQALKIGLMTENECDSFLSTVIAKGSKLPFTKISKYKARELFL